jgi:hypothetical protein
MLRSKFARSKKARSTIRICGASLVAATLVVLHAKAAEAQINNGKWAGSVADCAHNHSIGPYSNNEIVVWNPYTGGYDKYGYMEWFYSNTGQCAGYQWVRLFITQKLFVNDQHWLHEKAHTDDLMYQIFPLIMTAPPDPPTTGIGSVIYTQLAPGQYDGGLIFSPHQHSCSSFVSNAVVFRQLGPSAENVVEPIQIEPANIEICE